MQYAVPRTETKNDTKCTIYVSRLKKLSFSKTIIKDNLAILSLIITKYYFVSKIIPYLYITDFTAFITFSGFGKNSWTNVGAYPKEVSAVFNLNIGASK